VPFTSGHCKILSSAARITLRKQRVRLDHITADIHDFLHWLPVQQRILIEYKMCVLLVGLYKSLHQSAPIYLSELCIPVAATAKRSHLRSAVFSYCRTKRYGQRTFAYSGPVLRNSYPLTVRNPSLSLTRFCAQLKSVMLSRTQ